MYSSIEENERNSVIKNCYWPLIELSEKGYKIGIEAPAITLEMANSIDPDWIEALKEQIKKQSVEFIGSGYSQIIGPLVPAKVNDYNQRIGQQVYHSLLDVNPKIALVNEMAYSAGIVEHYINYGYNAIIMEWNNPRKYHPEWENKWRYYPQYVVGYDNREIPVIWADSIAFQKFQRYAHGEIELDEYITYIQSHDSNSLRYFSLYANDVEIFNFRPGRYSTETNLDKSNEWQRIFELYDYLQSNDIIKFVSPGEVLYGLSNQYGGNRINLESPEQPIPVKKQEKYNINRWALTGRDDLEINTKCYQIYQSLIDKHDQDSDHWKELCYLWSSDFRTHIANFRWKEYLDRLNGYSYVKSDYGNSRVINDLISISLPFQQNNISITEERKYINYENDKIFLSFDKSKGFTISKCIFKNISNKPLFGMIEHGYYDDISYGADFYTGHCVIEPPGKHKITDLMKVDLEIQDEVDKTKFFTTCGNNQICYENEITIFDKEIKFKKKITLPTRSLQTIHPFYITFNPEAWDYRTLYFETNNGGNDIERYYLTDNVNHSDILSSLISAKHGLGATEGILIIGDKDKSIKIQNDNSVSAIIPSVIFSKLSDGKFFLRLQYSAQEIDETFILNNKMTCIYFILNIIIL